MAKGPNGKPIGIPRNAFPASREFRLKSVDRSWGFSSMQRDALLREAEVVDDTEDEEDLLFLRSDDECPPPAPVAKSKGIWGWKGKGKGKRVEDVVILWVIPVHPYNEMSRLSLRVCSIRSLTDNPVSQSLGSVPSRRLTLFPIHSTRLH